MEITNQLNMTTREFSYLYSWYACTVLYCTVTVLYVLHRYAWPNVILPIGVILSHHQPTIV